MRSEITLDYILNTRVSFIFSAIELLSKFFDNLEIFRKHPEYKYSLFDFLINEHGGLILHMYSQIPATELDSLIKKKLEEIDDKSALTAFIFSRMNIFNINMNRQSSLIQQRNAYIQKSEQLIRQMQQNQRH